MTRVSDNSAKFSVDFSLSKAKEKLENLHLKGSSFKNITKPSDNPSGNTQVLTLKSLKSDNEQFLKNSNIAKAQLDFTESALSDLSDVVLRAKELAVQQASGIYGGEIRKQVSEEVNQLRLQSVSIANRRFGNRYIFSGHKALTPAVSKDGHYIGDDGKISVEVSKDFFVPVNINGLEVFYGNSDQAKKHFDPRIYNEAIINDEFSQEESPSRSLAGAFKEADKEHQPSTAPYEERVPIDQRKYPGNGATNLFQDLASFRNALETNNQEIVQDLLEKFDDYTDHIVKIRTKVGAAQNSIENSMNQVERDIITHETYRSKIEDIDLAELTSDLQRQKTVLDATYRTSAQLLNSSLMDFLR